MRLTLEPGTRIAILEEGNSTPKLSDLGHVEVCPNEPEPGRVGVRLLRNGIVAAT